jgi:cell envelope-related function transcriptional attenuator common domain
VPSSDPSEPTTGTGGARRGRHSHPRRGLRRSVGRVVQFLAGLLSLTVLLGFGYGWYEYRSLNAGLHRVHLSNLAQATTPKPTPGSHHVDGVEQNILVVGMDSRAGLSRAEERLLSVGSDVSLSTDTIMIIHIPADGSKATLISIPRDSYVDIPGGYLKNKINAAYADVYPNTTGTAAQKEAAGMNELIATVHELTGLSINHYVQVGFGGFYTIAKAIHGIPVDLCQATDDTIAHNIAEGNGQVGSNFKMSAGEHDLTPVQALEFVRQRHNLKGGDLGREARQRYFIKAAFAKMETAGVLLNPSELSNLINAVTGAFVVDDGFSILDLANQMSDLSAGNIVGYTIPTEGSSTVNIDGQNEDVELVDPSKVRAAVAADIAGHPAVKASPHPSSSSAAPSTAGTSAASKPASPGCIN